jgi:hypothetical protein
MTYRRPHKQSPSSEEVSRVEGNAMVAEVFAGLGAFKTALDMAKGLKDIDDAVRRNAAVIDLQETILAAQQAQSSLIEKVRELEKEVTDLKAWGAEKEKYELKNVGQGSFAYVRKKDAQPSEPSHWLCAQCYQNSKKSILQYVYGDSPDHIYDCSACGEKIRVHFSVSPSGT